MLRIGIIGVPGTGKTTLARAVASSCRDTSRRVELVSEYARRYISKHGSIDNIWEQYRVTEKQIEWEDSISEENVDLLVTDSPVHLGFLYSTEFITNHHKDIMVYNDIFKKLSKLNEGKPRYDIIFHLPPDIQFVQSDGIRKSEYLDEQWRIENDISIKFIFGSMFRPGKFLSINNTDIEYRTNYVLRAIEDIL